MGPEDDTLPAERQMELLARNVFRVIVAGAVAFTFACVYVLNHA